ncbi:MAG: polysaccharide deacetylase family protein [Candidatus Desulforudis sp.]|nr:polysaccharide deacetylase family protein [Desulforudis sp.]
MFVKRLTLSFLLAGVLTFLVISGSEARQIHRVTTGENLCRIAAQYGTAVDKLAVLNNLENPNLIYAGQVLVVPILRPQDAEKDPEPIHSGGPMETVAKAMGSPVVNQPPVARQPPIPQMAATSPTPAERNLTRLLKDHPSDFASRGPSELKQAALTFDDGPDDRHTPMILDILHRERVRATFFLIGNRVAKHPDVVKRLLAEGHVIGNHSWSHPNFLTLSPEGVRSQICRTEQEIFALTGKRTALFRPPYGYLSEENLKTLVAMGYKSIYWSADSLDWQHRDADQVLIHVLTATRRGSIILMHSAGGTDGDLNAAAAALPDLVYTLRVQGYSFVTVDELLGSPAYRDQAGKCVESGEK